MIEEARAPEASPEPGPDLKSALAEAHVPSLALTLVHLTGDASWIEDERPAYAPFGGDQGGLSEAFQTRVRDAVARALKAFAEGRPLPPAPGPALVRRMMDWIVGLEIPERYVAFLQEELALDGIDRKKPVWSAPELKAAAPELSALIVGAGMSGLLAAIRLKEAGVPFEIVEKNRDVGGTWLENTYPGVRVDTPNHLYSYSFEPNHEWPARYSTGDVLLDYFRRTARRHGLYERISFETRLVRTEFREADGIWVSTLEGLDGARRTVESRVVITAVGQLNQPRLPAIEGLSSFAGESFHSARWPKDFDPSGKRIAVIGTGASAFQFVPEIASKAASLTIYQRSPPWLAPTADYHEPVGPGKRALLETAPFYDRWYRFYLFWTMTDGVYEAVKADEDWNGGTHAVGAANAELGRLLIQSLAAQAEDRPDLLGKATPAYPFGGKRALRDNGVWMSALKRENVSLVSDPIARITPRGIETQDGEERSADVLIFGTGFKASDFLSGVEVVGRGGRELHAHWDGDARAYLGMLAPGFPNFFSIYGPNTNIVVNGSIIFFSECAVRYILGCLELMARSGAKTLEVREETHAAFNERVDAANARMAWGAPQVSSWYKNAKGRVSQNWPFPLVDYWEATLKPDPEELILGDAAGAS